ncbi:MAG TPA: protein kinase [Ktedonosporobacter sp.]|nr:protein kinase [Ktedonosporobacter sp.]
MTMPVSEGQRLGNYRLHRLLGRGSFADVYLGEHLYLHTPAAIKVLQRTLDEEEEQLFLAEAQTIASFAHRNIIRVREFAIERSIPYLVMDYAPGGTLRRRYPKGTCLSLEQTVTTTKQIAAALQYAHNRGFIHRDVKPDNVLQGAEQALLSDFGISITAPRPNTTTPQSWAGTLPYMAPEQFLGQAVFASDQYALAIMAYEWLCGERPFEGSGTTLAYQHTHVPPPRLREKDPSLPEAVEAVVLKALSKHPEQRYVSILSFARALERACLGEGSYTISADGETELADEPHVTSTWRVFVSHAASDDMTRLHKDLTLRNLAVHNEEASSSQDSNSSSEEQTRQAIRAAQVVLLVLTPHTRTAAPIHDHLRIARLYRRRILCLWQEGETLQELLPEGAEQATILDARGPRYKEALDEIIRAIERERRGVTNVATALPELTFEPRNPYKGLQAFTRHDRADFFGRQALVQELLVQIKEQLSNSFSEGASVARFLAVVGPSGSGKSSVVMAGLLPALVDGALPGSADWSYLDPLVPGPQPLDALASLLAARFPAHHPQGIRELLGKPGGFGLHQLGLTLMSQAQMRIVVTIDQFEQIFSSDIAEPERQHFLDVLVRAATEPHGPVLVLLSLRADFYDRPFAYPALGRLIQQHQCAVLPMNQEELREVIERPALLPDVRLTFDDDLVGDLLFDLHGQSAALPLLEFALSQLFAHRRQHRLTRAAYHEIGGVRGALAQHAEATYIELPSDSHRQLACMLFLRLVQPGEGGQEPLRRRAQASEFELEDASHTQALQQVIDAFLAARLITSARSLGISTLEVSHEALLREWPRLALWIREAREDMLLQEQLAQDVHEWERRGKPKDRLYRGSQLKESLVWQVRNAASRTEATFLRTSTKRRTRTRINLVLAALLLLSILVPAGVIFEQRFAPLTVTTLQDEVPGSLRQAISQTIWGGTILIDPNLKGTLTLNKDLVINQDVTIRGSNINQVVIHGKRDLSGLIQIQPHTNVTFFHLTFNDPTLALGSIIVNQGTLTLEDCQLTDSKQQAIPAQFVQGVFDTGGAAGAIDNFGTLILNKSLIARNTVNFTTGKGIAGGIFNGGTLIANNSQIVENAVVGSGRFAAGGGIVCSVQSQTTLINTTVARNRVAGASVITEGGGIYCQQANLTIKESTISNNSVQGGKGGYSVGGGIMSDGSVVSIDHSNLEGNTVQSDTTADKTFASGGAICSAAAIDDKNKVLATASVDITDSVLSNNTIIANTLTRGGGVAALSGSLSLTRTTVANNRITSEQAVAAGGGIFSRDNLTITDSMVSDNSATGPAKQYGAIGGGISNSGTFTLLRATIARNTVNSSEGTAAGGGIYNDTAFMTGARFSLTNCTIADNQAQGAQGIGGGFATDIQPIGGKMDFCTIAGNTASTRAGGIDADPATTPQSDLLLLKNSIVAGNTAPTGPEISRSVITGGYNLVQDWDGAQALDPLAMHRTDLTIKSLMQVGIATQLRMNGGPTPTLALQAGSPAIDAIPVTSCDVSTDQRGVKRPQHTGCDIGSYEYS